MVGVVIVTHGSLAQALLEAASLIVGEIPRSVAVCLDPGDGPNDAREKVETAIASVEEGEGTLLLVDLPGGTPCSVCLGCLGQSVAEVVAGVNLSMLVKVPFVRSVSGRPLSEYAEEIASYGAKAVRVISHSGCETAPSPSK